MVMGIVAVSAVRAADAPPPKVEAGAEWRDTVRQFAAKYFRHPAWGYSHSTRDYELAKQLAAADGVKLDDDVLFAAAYFHDMAAFAPWAKEGVDHQDEAARIVDVTLQDSGFPMAKIDAVRGAIRTHMFARDPQGPEALYLHDADALDWLGAIGVARIIGIVDPKGGMPDGPGAIKRIEDNVANVPSRVLSPAGRAMVPARLAETQQFLKTLREESSDLRNL
jgi:hypothetical protein